ncbi:hypothetical protein MHM88_21645 [Epibacterium sp. MM17-32]|uniref:hypothetical protein n=1 Tax=Epibacterium sp. MM17-32 TaxID=2917734 RepID=UPI001EF72D66|nr:hypothetical protein [Epibacterium sp. MM17-32]MCG7630415.1 hypothetical protein [Epibacterium sp. MM17-32]
MSVWDTVRTGALAGALVLAGVAQEAGQGAPQARIPEAPSVQLDPLAQVQPEATTTAPDLRLSGRVGAGVQG